MRGSFPADFFGHITCHVIGWSSLCHNSRTMLAAQQTHGIMLPLSCSSQRCAPQPIIALEELGLQYQLRRVALESGEHKTYPLYPDVLPASCIPVLIDHGLGHLRLFQSGDRSARRCAGG